MATDANNNGTLIATNITNIKRHMASGVIIKYAINFLFFIFYFLLLIKPIIVKDFYKNQKSPRHK